MEPLLVALSWLSAIGSALIAGVFFAFSTFVMRALARLPPAQGIAAMQSINIVVVRSWFMAPLLGTVATSAILALAALLMWSDPRAVWWLGGAALYVVGTFLITIAGNVPLNDGLAAVSPDTPEGAGYWTRYLEDWLWWNHVRTAASLAAATCFVLAMR
jgi:uncharacterized membrane protein